MPLLPKEEDFDEMSVDDQIQYVQILWDRIAEHSDEIELTHEQQEELDRRLERMEESPDEGESWATIRERLRDH